MRGAVTLRGVKSNLEGVAIVKVGGSEDAIRAAAQRFLQQQDGIVGFTQEVLSGALRAIVGRMSVEDIIRDRAAFAGQVAEEAEASLSGQGLILDAFQIQDITTEGSYLEDLGRPEAARAKQEADIAEAIAKRASEQARLKAAEEIAIAERTYYLKQAEIKAETEAAAAKANAAYLLAEAARQQEVLQEQEKVAERQAALTDRELDTKVRKPADAARYQAEQEAEARRIAQVKEAEADAERSRLTGQGEKLHRSALADAVRIEGEADAAAIAAKGAAEAEAMQKKADAFARYGDAAVLQMLVEVLPSVVAKASEPLSAIDKMTVISTDGASQPGPHGHRQRRAGHGTAHVDDGRGPRGPPPEPEGPYGHGARPHVPGGSGGLLGPAEERRDRDQGLTREASTGLSPFPSPDPDTDPDTLPLPVPGSDLFAAGHGHVRTCS